MQLACGINTLNKLKEKPIQSRQKRACWVWLPASGSPFKEMHSRCKLCLVSTKANELFLFPPPNMLMHSCTLTPSSVTIKFNSSLLSNSLSMAARANPN